MQRDNFGTTEEAPNYSWPASVLDYVRKAVSNDITGEIFENSLPVPMEIFLKANKVSSL